MVSFFVTGKSDMNESCPTEKGKSCIFPFKTKGTYIDFMVSCPPDLLSSGSFGILVSFSHMSCFPGLLIFRFLDLLVSLCLGLIAS